MLSSAGQAESWKNWHGPSHSLGMIAVVYIGNRVTRKFREAHQLSGNNFICKIFTLDDKVEGIMLEAISFYKQNLNRILCCKLLLQVELNKYYTDWPVHSGKVWGVMWTLSFPGDFSFDLPYKASTACNNQEICVRVWNIWYLND